MIITPKYIETKNLKKKKPNIDGISFVTNITLVNEKKKTRVTIDSKTTGIVLSITQ